MAKTRDGRDNTPTVWALDVEGVKSATFWASKTGSLEIDTGVVYDEVTGQEYDVRKVRHGWNVNDDFGRNHYGLTLRHAIIKARAANQ